MTDHFQRSQLLINQGRYDLAEKELRQILGREPDYASAHGLLAFCLAEKKQYGEALKEISEAIALSPGHAWFHYVHAGILQSQKNVDEATASILEALRLNPEKADYYARLASIQYDQSKHTEVLEATEQGLRVAAEHFWCMNMRLLSLLALRRIAEAETEVNNTLAIVPNQYFPHAMKGWVMLHQNKIPEALQSFREALRIESGQEWARKGLIEALKARNGLYRFILRLDLGRSRLKPFQEITLVLLLIVPYIQVLILIPILLAVATKPLFTLLLCFDSYGKLTLTPEEVTKTKAIAFVTAFCIPGVILSLITRQIGWALIVPIISILASSFIHFKRSPSTESRIQFLLCIPICFCAVTLAVSTLLSENFDISRSILVQVAFSALGLAFAGLALAITGEILKEFIITSIKPLIKPTILITAKIPLSQKDYILRWLKPYEDIAISQQDKSNFRRAAFLSVCFIPGIPLYILTYQAGWLFIAPALFILIYSLKKINSSETHWKDKVKFIYTFLISLVILIPGTFLFLPLSPSIKLKLIIMDLSLLIIIAFLGFCLFFMYIIVFESISMWKVRFSVSKNTLSNKNRK